MLQKNIMEQTKNALEKAVSSGNSELEERLNICKMVLGNYIPTEEDLSRFQQADADYFEEFYRKYLYRMPDAVIQKGSGVVFSLNSILNALEQSRLRLGISQPDLDKIKTVIEGKRRDLASFSEIKSDIEKAQAELDHLNKQHRILQTELRKMEELIKQIADLKNLISANKEILSGNALKKTEEQIADMRQEFRGEMADTNLVEEIIRLAVGIGVLSKVDLDLFCEYLEDKNVVEKIKNAGELEKESLKKLRDYEIQLDSNFKDYRDCLCSIINNLPPRKDKVGSK